MNSRTSLCEIDKVGDRNGREVYAILLAAGESKRFPPNKLFLPWGKTTILEQTVENLLRSRVSETVVVLGYQGKKVASILRNKRCHLVVNPDYRQGMGTSVIKGIDYWLERPGLPPEAGLLLALGDEPFIPPEIIDKVVFAYQTTQKGIVVPTYKGRRGHPLIFHRKYASEIIEVCEEVGAREILRRYPGDILEVEMETEAILLDIDTLEDYGTLFKRFNP